MALGGFKRATCGGAIIALTSVLVLNGASASAASCDFSAWHPRRYAVYQLQAHQAIQLDGVLNDSAWEQVAWSEPFVDIHGEDFWLQPWFETKFKMRYDQEFLYVGALLQETSLWANVTMRNEVVFQDNDFEVFVDPSGTTHGYKEFEMNVINTTWNLLLDKPYLNDGHENSTRVDPEYGFDMFGKGMTSAAFVPGGKVNDPTVQSHYWTCEIALPLKELVRYSPVSTGSMLPPRIGSFWRINFSRVEWLVSVDTITKRFVKVPNVPENNWVWSPQGKIAMHMPEKWGYIQFREPPSATTSPIHRSKEQNQYLEESFDPTVPLDPEWNLRFAAFEFYEAQVSFKQQNRKYADQKELLRPFFKNAQAFDCLHVVKLEADAIASYFQVQLALCTDASRIATIRSDRFIKVEPSHQIQQLDAMECVE